MNLTKYVHAPYEENCRTDNRSQRDVNKWRSIPGTGIERLNIVKMSVLPNLMYGFSAIPFKILASYFVNIDKLVLSLYTEGKDPEQPTQC